MLFNIVEISVLADIKFLLLTITSLINFEKKIPFGKKLKIVYR